MPALIDRRAMPLQIEARLVTSGVLTAEAFRVYCYLCLVATREGVSMPSQKDIGDAVLYADYSSSDVRVKHVRTATKELEELGYIVRQRETNNGMMTNIQYVLTDLDGREPEEAPVRQPQYMEKIDETWKNDVFFILYGHSKYNTGMPAQWRNVVGVIKKLQAGKAKLEQVRAWYKDVWRQTWPGNQPHRPCPAGSQVVSGVMAYVEEQEKKPQQVELRIVK